MRPSTHLVILLSSFLIFASGLIWFLKITDPGKASVIQFVLLYTLVFLATFSAMSVIGYAIRTLFLRGARYEFIKTAERQGIFLGLMVVGALLLQSVSLLNIWTALLLLISFILLELYALSN